MAKHAVLYVSIGLLTQEAAKSEVLPGPALDVLVVRFCHGQQATAEPARG